MSNFNETGVKRSHENDEEDETAKRERLEGPPIETKFEERIEDFIKTEEFSYEDESAGDFNFHGDVNVEEIDAEAIFSQALAGIEGPSSSLLSNKSTKKRAASYSGMWNPISFGLTNLYDLERGIPLSRAECEENIKKLDRKDLETDYYEYLEFAAKVHGKDDDLEQLAVGMAFNSIMQNKMLRRLKSKGIETKDVLDELVIRRQQFSLESANSIEEVVNLPSGKSFRLSQIITPYIASKWSSTTFEVDCKNLFRYAYQKVAEKDHFFAGYAAADKSTMDYVPMGEQFYQSMAKYAIQGFRQEHNETMLSKVMKMARDVLSNFLDRIRQKARKDENEKAPNEIGAVLKEQLRMTGGVLVSTPIDFDN